MNSLVTAIYFVLWVTMHALIIAGLAILRQDYVAVAMYIFVVTAYQTCDCNRYLVKHRDIIRDLHFVTLGVCSAKAGYGILWM